MGTKWIVMVAALACLPADAASRRATEMEIQLIRQGMRDLLPDADSAELRNVNSGLGQDESMLCGDVSPRGEDGQPSPFRTFIATRVGSANAGQASSMRSQVVVLGIDEFPDGAMARLCRTRTS